MISSFVREGKKRYFITNLSSVFPNEVNIQLKKGEYLVIQGNEKNRFDGKIHLSLNPGEAAYLVRID